MPIGVQDEHTYHTLARIDVAVDHHVSQMCLPAGIHDERIARKKESSFLFCLTYLTFIHLWLLSTYLQLRRYVLK